jgi:hypothetical protein
VQDLQRVGVHRANAIVLQLAQADQAEDSAVTCGVTLRTLMALRFVLQTCRSPPPWERLRVVVEMNQSDEVVDAARFSAPDSSRTIVHAQDLTHFLNSLIFTCLGQAGLAQVQLELMSFDGASIKFRKASDFHNNGEGLVGRTLREVGLPWENAVLLGARTAEAAMQDEGPSGMLVDPMHQIQASDTLLFLCECSMPKPALQAACVEEDDWAPPSVSRVTCSEVLGGDHTVLICGWGSEWDNPEAFLFILDEISSNARQGMKLSVNFMVENSHKWFQDHMGTVQALANTADRTKRIVEVPKPDEPSSWVHGGEVKIAHTEGDAANFAELFNVLRAQHYEEAIIIPPKARTEMKPILADTWVVRVILSLRHGSKKLTRDPPHIVAQNALDATSKLVMVLPDSQGHPVVPDFVNAQAIKARALCQVLAYPEMNLVLQDLFSKEAGSPLLMLVSVDTYGLRGQTIAFRTVVKRVLELQPLNGQADDVCLGFRTADGTLRMPPPLSEEHTFGKRDKIIIVTRKAPTSEVYESMVRDQSSGTRSEVYEVQVAAKPPVREH